MLPIAGKIRQTCSGNMIDGATTSCKIVGSKTGRSFISQWRRDFNTFVQVNWMGNVTNQTLKPTDINENRKKDHSLKEEESYLTYYDAWKSS